MRLVGTLPVVPVVLWPTLDGHREQADLSRLLAELMCKSMRLRLGGLGVDIQPALTDWAEMTKCGVQRWEEWQLVEIDQICPHCGAVNWGPCCAESRTRDYDRELNYPIHTVEAAQKLIDQLSGAVSRKTEEEEYANIEQVWETAEDDWSERGDGDEQDED